MNWLHDFDKPENTAEGMALLAFTTLIVWAAIVWVVTLF